MPLPIDYEDQITKTMDGLDKLLHTEVSIDETDEAETAGLDAFIRRIPGWLRIGYRRARRRWRTDSSNIFYVFEQIAAQADKYLKVAERGDEITVTVNMAQLDAQVRHRSYYDLYPDEESVAS